MYRGVKYQPSTIVGVVLDIDGTLLEKTDEALVLEYGNDHDHLIHDFNRLHWRETKFTYATGRAFAGIRYILEQSYGLPAFHPPKGSRYRFMPVILYNGSLIVSSNGRFLHRKREISGEICKELVEEALNYRLLPLIYCLDKKVLMALEERVFSILKSGDMITDLNGLRIEYVEKPEDLNINSAVSILLYGAMELSTSEKRRLLMNLRNLARASIFGDRIEISPKDANKGVALLELANMLNWNINHVMVVGDNINDIEMLKVAGMGVALANSPPEVKEKADYITEHSYSSGVMEAIYKGVIAEEWKVKPHGEFKTTS